AKAITKQLSEKFSSEDRVAIASVAGKYFQHTGFISNKDAKLAEACQALNEFTPMGVADLKSAIQSSEKLFADNTSTRKLIVYIGDGVSALNPMTAEDRTILASNLLSKEIQF
ncbi:MAG TPA: hypothetical protein PKA06_12450, partial [Gemmatales bacterium]|nr:hypothetical protein [Gemmatales bacterium]